MKFPKLLVLMLCVSTSFLAQTNTYTESNEDITNPDRGFYTPYNGIASNFEPLNAGNLAFIQSGYTPFNATYTARTSIVFRHFILDSFVNTPISTEFLNQIQTDFDTARSAGVRLLLRFSYTITPSTSVCCEPPYGDATKTRILEHIAQLKPLFQQNEDVILALQSGFIGVFGEQYYTDHFGDASLQGKLTDTNWQDRIDVLTALLDALPESRMIQVRWPQIKQKFIYGINADVSSAAITSTQAHNGSDIARIGFHNDCFLADANDQGTFNDYGTSSTNSSAQPEILKPYAAADSQFTVTGGETCVDGYSNNDCLDDDGNAENEFANLHFSYLNAAYNNEVNNDWETGGCLSEIKNRLGYRFVLQSGTFATSVASGANFNFNLNILNRGFAAPFNPYNLNLILRNTATGAIYELAFASDIKDIRFWLPGEAINLTESLALPEVIEEGDYEVLLHVNDTSNNGAIANNPNYSIQFANENTWESTTGYNNLLHTLSITNETLSVLEQNNLTDQVRIFPNPASDNIVVNLKSATETPFDIRLYSLSGKLLAQTSNTEAIIHQNLPVAQYPNGVYLLVIVSAEAKLVKKIEIAH